jgi:hypothetical protein
MGSTVVEPLITIFPAHAIWIPEKIKSAAASRTNQLFFIIIIFLLLYF